MKKIPLPTNKSDGLNLARADMQGEFAKLTKILPLSKSGGNDSNNGAPTETQMGLVIRLLKKSRESSNAVSSKVKLGTLKILPSELTSVAKSISTGLGKVESGLKKTEEVLTIYEWIDLEVRSLFSSSSALKIKSIDKVISGRETLNNNFIRYVFSYAKLSTGPLSSFYGMYESALIGLSNLIVVVNANNLVIQEQKIIESNLKMLNSSAKALIGRHTPAVGLNGYVLMRERKIASNSYQLAYWENDIQVKTFSTKPWAPDQKKQYENIAEMLKDLFWINKYNSAYWRFAALYELFSAYIMFKSLECMLQNRVNDTKLAFTKIDINIKKGSQSGMGYQKPMAKFAGVVVNAARGDEFELNLNGEMGAMFSSILEIERLINVYTNFHTDEYRQIIFSED